MREIKFRLIKDNKIVGYEEHRLVGDGMSPRKVYIYHSRTGHPMSWKEIITICPEEYLKHDDKNQFTGLLDKNEKEIYEGDIVCGKMFYDRDAEPEKIVGTVVFQDGAFQLNIDDMNVEHYFELEIIGNIHENPELLEKK